MIALKTTHLQATGCRHLQAGITAGIYRLSSIKTSLRFLGESMALVQSTVATHGDRLGKVEHYLDHVVAPAVAAAKPVSQCMPTPSPPPHVALLPPSDARTDTQMLQDGQAK